MSSQQRFYGFLAVTIAAGLTISCSSEQPRKAQVFQIGEKIELSPFIYNVVDTAWLTHIGEGATGKVPSNRFLVVHITAMNGGSQDAALPQLELIGGSGDEHPEVSDAGGVEGWIGLARSVKPADTLEGRVVFDVAPSTYRLRIQDPYDDAKAVLVELPLKFETPEPLLPQPKSNQ